MSTVELEKTHNEINRREQKTAAYQIKAESQPNYEQSEEMTAGETIGNSAPNLCILAKGGLKVHSLLITPGAASNLLSHIQEMYSHMLEIQWIMSRANRPMHRSEL